MILVTGDIHGRVERVLYQIQRIDIQPEDTIVLLGDAGLNYYNRDNPYIGNSIRSDCSEGLFLS